MAGNSASPRTLCPRLPLSPSCWRSVQGSWPEQTAVRDEGWQYLGQEGNLPTLLIISAPQAAPSRRKTDSL